MTFGQQILFPLKRMKMARQIKAISDEQKQERRQAIINAALLLFQRSPYDQVSMNKIAQKANIAKGTVYIYFKTKEELFLTLLMELGERFWNEYDAALQQVKSDELDNRIDTFIFLMEKLFDNHTDLIRLRAIVHIILENNINYDMALFFKQISHERMLTTGILLESCFPFLNSGDGAQFVAQMDIIILGFSQVEEPPPMMKEIIEKENLHLFKVDFKKNVLGLIKNLLSSLQK
jgi:AcrR family transcriptional regulator